MNNAKKNRNQVASQPQFDREVDRYFYEIDQHYNQNAYSIALLTFFVLFGLMGLIWMIPFPKLDFLERLQMQNFLNWGSFFIAIIVYSYLKLAPTLSYVILLIIALMSFLIVQLEYVERDGGATVVMVSTGIFFISLIACYLLFRKSSKKQSFNFFFKSLYIFPIWIISKLFQKFGWKY